MTDARRRQRAPRRALKQQPSPAKCEIVHRRPMPDNAPVSLSDPFGPLRGRRDGSARDRPRSAHQRRERRWADAHVARKDLSLALGLLWLADHLPFLGRITYRPAEGAWGISDSEREPSRFPKSLTLNLLCLADHLPFLGALRTGRGGGLVYIVYFWPLTAKFYR